MGGCDVYFYCAVDTTATTSIYIYMLGASHTLLKILPIPSYMSLNQVVLFFFFFFKRRFGNSDRQYNSDSAKFSSAKYSIVTRRLSKRIQGDWTWDAAELLLIDRIWKVQASWKHSEILGTRAARIWQIGWNRRMMSLPREIWLLLCERECGLLLCWREWLKRHWRTFFDCLSSIISSVSPQL